MGAATPEAKLQDKVKSSAVLSEAHGRMVEHLHANNVDLGETPLTAGVPLMIDAKGEKFTGPDAAKANAMLTRQYRAPYLVPKLV